MSKAKKVAIGVSAAVLVLLTVVLIVFCPRRGVDETYIWAVSDDYSSGNAASLEKTAGEDFTILLFTDIQLWTLVSDNRRAFAIMDELVERTDPDLIVLPGDNVSGISTDILTLQLVSKMESYGVPWAPVFGNHDAEGNATLEWQGDRIEEAEHCLFDRGPTDLYGVGNYFVNIFEDGAPIYSLCFMDNGRYIDYGDRTAETYVDYAQIAWYKWNIEGLNAEFGTSVPSMSFSHFAFPEMREAVEKYGILSDDGRYVIPEDMGEGSCAYLPGAAPVNSGFFETAKTSGLTHAFFGHDHENDARITVDGVTLSYGLKTGPSPRPWNSAKEYGGTVITIGDGGVSVRNEVVASAD